jgi:LysM repeat protein
MLAPISLVAFAVVFLIVIVSSLGGGSESKSKAATATAQQTGKRTSRSRRTRTTSSTGTTGTTGTTGATGATGASGATGAFANRRVYVVRAGDTLVKIADRTGVPIEDLLSLNPSIDPQGLVTGQRVKLRE